MLTEREYAPVKEVTMRPETSREYSATAETPTSTGAEFINNTRL